jgi:hypothetical protein
LNRCARERAQVPLPVQGAHRHNVGGQSRWMIRGSVLQSSWGMSAHFLRRSALVHQPFDADYYARMCRSVASQGAKVLAPAVIRRWTICRKSNCN